MPEEQKSRYTEAQKKAIQKYFHESVEEIKVRVPKGEKAVIRAAAEAAGESVNQYILAAIRERMGR